MAEEAPLLILAPGDVRLDTGKLKGLFTDLVGAAGLANEIQMAYEHVQRHIPTQALGKSCACTDVNTIRAKCADPLANFLTSGTLSQLDLQANAISTLDYGAMQSVMGLAVSVKRLHGLIGPISINADAWGGDEMTNLQRAEKDAIVMGLSLIIYWMRDDLVISEALKDIATDLTFKFQKLGTGPVGPPTIAIWHLSHGCHVPVVG